MPKQITPQQTGRTGERWFVSQLPPNWIFQPPLEDIGIDGVVVICETGRANGLEFRVQIKSSALFRRKRDRLILPNIKRSAMRYWVTGFTPTLIVAFETSSKTGFCAWANQILASKTEVLSYDDGLLALEVLTGMPVDERVWDRIRDQVGGIYSALGRKLILAGTVVPFVQAINQLCGALKGLYFAEAARPPEPQRTEAQRRLMHELEVTCHRDVVRGIIALERELAGQGETIEGLRQYPDEYAQRCSGFIRGFRETIVADANDPVECEVIPEGLAVERRPLMKSIADALHELTQAAVHASRAQGAG